MFMTSYTPAIIPLLFIPMFVLLLADDGIHDELAEDLSDLGPRDAVTVSQYAPIFWQKMCFATDGELTDYIEWSQDTVGDAGREIGDIRAYCRGVFP